MCIPENEINEAFIKELTICARIRQAFYDGFWKGKRENPKASGDVGAIKKRPKMSTKKKPAAKVAKVAKAVKKPSKKAKK